MADIIVDTYKLNQYAQRISTVNSRINRLDRRLDSLYWRVGLQGLWNLMQADALTCYSWRLNRCQAYLRDVANDFERVEKELLSEDASKFKGKNTSVVLDAFSGIGNAIKKGSNKVKKYINDALVSYYSQGDVYKYVQYGKAVLKGIKGVGKIVAGVGGIFATGGASSPVSILTLISGCNDVYNAIMDATYTYVEDYDKIGTDALKETLKEGGGIIGKLFGKEDIGENVGSIIYYGIDLVSALSAIDKSFDIIKQLPKTNMAQLGSELKEILNMDVVDVLKMSEYDIKLASYTYKTTATAFSTLKTLLKTADKAIDVGDSLNDIISVGSSSENEVLNFFKNISDVSKEIGNGIKKSKKVASYIFG